MVPLREDRVGSPEERLQIDYSLFPAKRCRDLSTARKALRLSNRE